MSRFAGDTVVLNFYMGLFICLTTGCRQKYYVLHHECSQALASYAMNSNCSRVDFLKERPFCEVGSMEDSVALRRMVLVVGLQPVCFRFYSDVIMSGMASQITSTICSTLCSGTDQRKHQSSVALAFVRGIHRWPVDCPRKGQWCVFFSVWWHHHEYEWLTNIEKWKVLNQKRFVPRVRCFQHLNESKLNWSISRVTHNRDVGLYI